MNSKKKKKIGLSFSKTNFANYWNWFSTEDLGDEFELVELSFEANNQHDIEVCDGFILTGGVDIEPSKYDGEHWYEEMPDEFQSDRDHFEEKIYRISQAKHKPVLGICRGMQLVNVLQGGKLVQDLGQVNEVHRKTDADKEHLVRVEEGSLLREVLDCDEGSVNSAHHQAVDPNGLGVNIMANAYSAPDGKVIEGIEFREKAGKPFMLCVQWHPERMKRKDETPFSQNIKTRFLEEVRRQPL
ncbi:MAG: gamma-glutamyl-gamma-aminobutyrate hydrolase family protein [Chitinophagales bacterium]